MLDKNLDEGTKSNNFSWGIVLNGIKKSYDSCRLAFNVIRLQIERFKWRIW